MLADTLADYAIPLDTVDPTADFDDLEPFYEYFADARIVALGEATHGTREFFRLKHRLLRYLVTELDVRVSGLEANFSEALALDEYVVHGQGNPIDALETVYFWTWCVESVVDMLEWLREFNADRPVGDCVRFYGLDAQYSQGAVEELVEFFERVDPDFLSAVRDDLDTVADGGLPPHRDDRCDVRVRTAETVVPDLRDRLDEKQAIYVSEIGSSAWELAHQHVAVVEQASDYKHALLDYRNDCENAGLKRCLDVRDRAMADSVDWILEHEDADRMALWAHDAHVNRVEQVSRQTLRKGSRPARSLTGRHGTLLRCRIR